MTGNRRAVIKLLCGIATFFTLANDFGLCRKVDGHSSIKCIKRTFPKPFVPKFIAIADDSALDLVDLFEAALFHD